MPVNFQQLSPIQAPQAMGSVPQNNQPNAGDRIGAALGGIANAMNQGQANARADQQLQMQKEEHGQNTILNQQKIEGGQMQLDAAKQEQRTAEAIRQDVITGRRTLLEAYTAHGQADKAMDYMKKEAEIDKLHAETYKFKEEGKQKEREGAAEAMINAGSIANTVMQLKDENGQPMPPERMMAYLEGAISLLPKEDQDFMKKIIQTQGLTENTALALQNLGGMAMAKLAEKNEKPTEKMQNAKQISILEQKVKNGTATDAEKTEYSSLKEQTAPTRMYADPLDTELAKTQAGSANKATERYAQGRKTLITIQAGREDLKNVPEYVMNPTMGWSGLQKLNPEFQKFNQKTQDIALSIKDSLYNLGSGQGFSNQDADRLESIVRGGVAGYKGTAEEALIFLENKMEQSNAMDWITANATFKKSKQYDAWLEANPEPKAKVKMKDGKVGYVPASQIQKIITEQGAVLY